MNKKCGVVVVLLLAVIVAGAWKFLVQGSTLASSDGRLAIQLADGERNLVLGEMRAFLVSVQQIVAAANREEMAAVAEAAAAVGAAAQQAVPGALMGKLPMEFKKLGFDTHRKFDLLAMDARDLGDPAHTLQQLGELMQNCVACHAAYRIDLERE